MTEEKKVATKKAPAKKVVAEKVEKAPKKEPVVEKRKLGNETQIEVMNNTTGRYGYTGKSGFSMEMSDYGDVLEVPFGELKRMRSEQKRHIEDAFIVILDEDAVKELRYEHLYKNVFNEEGVNELLQNPEKLDNVLPKMPPTMRETVGAIASRRFRDGSLYDIRIQKAIEKHLSIKIAE